MVLHVCHDLGTLETGWSIRNSMPSWVHGELEAILGYKKPCLKTRKSKTIVSAKVITQGTFCWDTAFPFLF